MLQLARYSTEGLLQLGPLGSTTFLPDTKCLVDDGRGRTPRLKKCDAVSRISQRLWDFTQVKRKHTISAFGFDLHQCNTAGTLNVMEAKIRHMLLSHPTGIRIERYFMNELLVLRPSVFSSGNCAILVMCFCCRTVQSSAGTLVDAWRLKCPKMPTLAFAWWSRDAPVRSG